MATLECLAVWFMVSFLLAGIYAFTVWMGRRARYLVRRLRVRRELSVLEQLSLASTAAMDLRRRS